MWQERLPAVRPLAAELSIQTRSGLTANGGQSSLSRKRSRHKLSFHKPGETPKEGPGVTKAFHKLAWAKTSDPHRVSRLRRAPLVLENGAPGSRRLRRRWLGEDHISELGVVLTMECEHRADIDT